MFSPSYPSSSSLLLDRGGHLSNFGRSKCIVFIFYLLLWFSSLDSIYKPAISQMSSPFLLPAQSEMKRSESELALEEVIKKTSQREIKDEHANLFSSSDLEAFLGDADFNFAFKNLESCGVWSDKNMISLSPNQSCCISSPPIDAYSSVCDSSKKTQDKEENQRRVLTSSGSSDDEDGPCEQSTNPVDVRRIRRMVSNRESARRSRKRRQAHLHDLELQVEQLSGENATLYKQLSDATQQCRDADTNYRVLKSDVDALRAKVKLAEGMVTGSLNPNQHLRAVPNVSPTITINGDHETSYGGISISGPANLRNSNSVISDAVSCLSDLSFPSL